MSLNAYVAALLRLYLDAPDTPKSASRRDRHLAAELYRQAVCLDQLAHAIRLATLRRNAHAHQKPHEAIHSLAYYHTVLQRLSAAELEPDYVAYVHATYQRIELTTSKPRPHRQNPALAGRR